MTNAEQGDGGKPRLGAKIPGGPARIQPAYDDLVTAFLDVVARAPDAPAIHYFDASISYGYLDELSSRFANWLIAHDVQKGDRLLVLLQNVPQFAIVVLGAWKVGAIPTPVNPGYRSWELAKLVADCEPKVIVGHPDALPAARDSVDQVGSVPIILTTSARAFQTHDDGRVLPLDPPASSAIDLLTEIAGQPGAMPAFTPAKQDLALLLYTSGTTGVPKGAMISHAAVAFNAEASLAWFHIAPQARVLAIAPLFHITGFVLHFAAAIRSGGSMVLTYRFQPQVILDAIAERRPTFVVGAITAFIALMAAPEAAQDAFESFDSIYSGGAPIPPMVAETFKSRFGKPLHNCFGMTETCAPTHVAPLGSVIPVDPISGALSIGVPISAVDAKIIDETGAALPPGERGQLLVRGPQLMDGYWRKPAETAEALADGWMHTGDVAMMDADGWFYLVDRQKDVIIASGFKVWPREVEDALYAHPTVREAAVVGVADPYRGQTVKAYIALKEGEVFDEAELVRFCRERLAGYKMPRLIEVLADLPKTPTGKIMRAALRERARSEDQQP